MNKSHKLEVAPERGTYSPLGKLYLEHATQAIVGVDTIPQSKGIVCEAGSQHLKLVPVPNRNHTGDTIPEVHGWNECTSTKGYEEH
jgi:hypothetical protein